MSKKKKKTNETHSQKEIYKRIPFTQKLYNRYPIKRSRIVGVYIYTYEHGNEVIIPDALSYAMCYANTLDKKIISLSVNDLYPDDEHVDFECLSRIETGCVVVTDALDGWDEAQEQVYRRVKEVNAWLVYILDGTSDIFEDLWNETSFCHVPDIG